MYPYDPWAQQQQPYGAAPPQQTSATAPPAQSPYAPAVSDPWAQQQASAPPPQIEQPKVSPEQKGTGNAMQSAAGAFNAQKAQGDKDKDRFDAMFHSSPMGQIQVTGRPSLAMSDRRAKTNIRPAKSALREWLDAIGEEQWP